MTAHPALARAAICATNHATRTGQVLRQEQGALLLAHRSRKAPMSATIARCQEDYLVAVCVEAGLALLLLQGGLP